MTTIPEKHIALHALADPEQCIYGWLGADPERLNHLGTEWALLALKAHMEFVMADQIIKRSSYVPRGRNRAIETFLP